MRAITPSGPGLFLFMRHLLGVMTVADRTLLATLFGVGTLSLMLVQPDTRSGETATVYVSNRLVAQLSLAADGDYHVAGASGPVDLRVADHSVRVLHSRCPEKICMRQGTIAHRGEVIVCVPNRLLISIEGRPVNAFDATTH